MYDALYDLNIEPDFVQAGSPDVSAYPIVLVPPLYSASDETLQQVSEYVKRGGHALMAFKSGFTNQYSTVRDVMAPGPLREAAGFHYQEFTSLAEPVGLSPDFYHVGDQNRASVWEEFLIPDTAEVIESSEDPYWKFPVITRNVYGAGSFTYEAAVITGKLQREIVLDLVKRAGLSSPDQDLPGAVKVRHGRAADGKVVHYYLNFSGMNQQFQYAYGSGRELLTNTSARHGSTLALRPWDLAIVAE